MVWFALSGTLGQATANDGSRLAADLHEAPTVAWSFDIAAHAGLLGIARDDAHILSVAALGDGRMAVVPGSLDDTHYSPRVLGVDASTGDLLWESSGFGSDSESDTLQCSEELLSGGLFCYLQTVDWENELFRVRGMILDPSDGSVRHEFSIDPARPSSQPVIEGLEVIDGDMVIALGDFEGRPELIRLSGSDGTEAWRAPLPTGEVFLQKTDSHLVVSSYDSGAVAILDPRTGDELYAERAGRGVSPVGRGFLLFEAGDGGGSGSSLMEFLGPDFQVQWSVRAAHVLGAPAGGWRTEDVVLLAEPNGRGIRAVDQRSGDELWAAPLDQQIAIGEAGSLLVLGGGPRMVAVDRNSGEVAWRAVSPDEHYQHWHVMRGPELIYAPTADYLVAYDPRDGREVWQVATDRLASPDEYLTLRALDGQLVLQGQQTITGLE